MAPATCRRSPTAEAALALCNSNTTKAEGDNSNTTVEKGDLCIPAVGCERILTALPDWGLVLEEPSGTQGVDGDELHLMKFTRAAWTRLVATTSPGLDTARGDYFVRMEWGSTPDWLEFYVPSGSDIFTQTAAGDIAIEQLSWSDGSWGNSIGFSATAATFCKACIEGGSRPGDTCWAVTPSGDNNRQCGCNSHGWSGKGIYYGGYKNPDKCDAHGGGFAGPKTQGQAKGNVNSVGLRLYVKQIPKQPPPAPVPVGRCTDVCDATSAADGEASCAAAGEDVGCVYMAPQLTCTVAAAGEGYSKACGAKGMQWQRPGMRRQSRIG